MKKFKRVLFPVDFSESSTKIVPYVQAMAEQLESEIHILFAARVFEYFTSIYVPHPSINKFEKEIIEGAEKRLYEFMDEHFSKFPNTKTTVVAGDASEQIINYIQDHSIDLVIMGTHGRKGMDKIIFGSVAERVVKTSPVPVMVVNPYKVGWEWFTKDFFLFSFLWRFYDPDQYSDWFGMVGRKAITLSRWSLDGHVRVHGERWQVAVADGQVPIKRGEFIRVVAVDSLKLTVKRCVKVTGTKFRHLY